MPPSLEVSKPGRPKNGIMRMFPDGARDSLELGLLTESVCKGSLTAWQGIAVA
jgi:hypothetical protein